MKPINSGHVVPSDEEQWQPIETAPYGVILEVRNPLMENPCLATRGYIYNGMVHEDQRFFTTVYTPHKYFPVFSGELCCPTEWRHPSHEAEQ